MKHYALIYFSTLIIMTLLDMLWIGGIARNFYKSRMGDMLELHLVPGIIFYLIYAAGIVLFVNGSPAAAWQRTLLYGALFGFFAYSTYDLTNMATLRFWPVELAIVDIAWGTFVTGLSATLALMASRYLEQL